ncbi:unnamed protein product, partial [Protopolystoma xenopodis]
MDSVSSPDRGDQPLALTSAYNHDVESDGPMDLADNQTNVNNQNITPDQSDEASDAQSPAEYSLLWDTVRSETVEQSDHEKFDDGGAELYRESEEGSDGDEEELGTVIREFEARDHKQMEDEEEDSQQEEEEYQEEEEEDEDDCSSEGDIMQAGVRGDVIINVEGAEMEDGRAEEENVMEKVNGEYKLNMDTLLKNSTSNNSLQLLGLLESADEA